MEYFHIELSVTDSDGEVSVLSGTVKTVEPKQKNDICTACEG